MSFHGAHAQLRAAGLEQFNVLEDREELFLKLANQSITMMSIERIVELYPLGADHISSFKPELRILQILSVSQRHLRSAFQ